MVPAAEPRSRWRLRLGRSAVVAEGTQRDVETAWVEAIEHSGLPAVRAEGGRPRLVFGAPLPTGMVANGELLDLFLTERWPRWRVREALEPAVPVGWTLRGLEDVWLGAPSLVGAVAAADYAITLSDDLAGAGLDEAIRAVLAAPALARERVRGAGTITYDLRPLLISLAVADLGPPPALVMRTRIHPTLGSGRPDEVVAAVGDALGHPLGIAGIVRERLVLAEDLADR